MSKEKKEITQQIVIYDKEGDGTSKLEVRFDRKRLRYGRKEELKDEANPLNYVEIDEKKMSEIENIGGDSNKASLFSIAKSVDFKKLVRISQIVTKKLTKICWGIEHLDDNQFTADDFDKLYEVTKEADILKLKKDKEDAKDVKKNEEETAEIAE